MFNATVITRNSGPLLFSAAMKAHNSGCLMFNAAVRIHNSGSLIADRAHNSDSLMFKDGSGLIPLTPCCSMLLEGSARGVSGSSEGCRRGET